MVLRIFSYVSLHREIVNTAQTFRLNVFEMQNRPPHTGLTLFLWAQFSTTFFGIGASDAPPLKSALIELEKF